MPSYRDGWTVENTDYMRDQPPTLGAMRERSEDERNTNDNTGN